MKVSQRQSNAVIAPAHVVSRSLLQPTFTMIWKEISSLLRWNTYYYFGSGWPCLTGVLVVPRWLECDAWNSWSLGSVGYIVVLWKVCIYELIQWSLLCYKKIHLTWHYLCRCQQTIKGKTTLAGVCFIINSSSLTWNTNSNTYPVMHLQWISSFVPLCSFSLMCHVDLVPEPST